MLTQSILELQSQVVVEITPLLQELVILTKSQKYQNNFMNTLWIKLSRQVTKRKGLRVYRWLNTLALNLKRESGTVEPMHIELGLDQLNILNR